MAEQYDNTNRGALFKNDRKESDSHPDYKGQINVDGVDCWLSAWLKTDKNGKKYMSLSVKKYMSLSVKPKDAAPAEPKPAAASGANPNAGVMDLDSDVPF